ncbi:MAG: ExbD/TolR family protein [Gammaproteobacteria bacterium]
MHIPDQPDKRELENLLPLVNVVFLLLIFFMVAGAFSSPELFIIEPTIAENELSANPELLTILVNQQGDLAINQDKIATDSLPVIINEYLESKPNSIVQLKPDANTEALRIVELLETLGTSNLDAVHIVTSASE